MIRRRAPLRRSGRLRRHRRKDYGQVWRWAMERADWRCEVAIDGTRCESPARQAHHILPRGRGGKDELGNLLAVCAPHHWWIHNHPTDSTLLGYLRSAHQPESA